MAAAAASESEGYLTLDFLRGDLSYAVKHHSPPKNRHSEDCSPAEVKEKVFQSPRLQRVMEEVGALLCILCKWL